MSGYIQANSNGRLHPATEPSISPLNRGYLYGDAVYEVWRTYDGVVFAWDAHWERLQQSAKALHLVLPFDRADLFREVKRTALAYRSQGYARVELYIRVQVTRGAGAIGLDTSLADGADYVILAQENRLFPADKYENGLVLRMAETRRNPPESLNPAWKTGNYLNNILCLREARTLGADEVVITNLKGEIAEAAVSNIAFVRKGVVITPPLSAGILSGITRGILLENVAPAAGVPVSEAPIRPEDLAAMDECFLLSSTKDVTPVASIEQHRFQVAPDSVTQHLKTAFLDYANRYAAAHPELAV